MKLEISNLGCLSQASIDLDGVTVLTGFNGTGKSTISKALYSLIYSSENLPEKLSDSCNDFVQNECRDIYYQHFSLPRNVNSLTLKDDHLYNLFQSLRNIGLHYPRKEPVEWVDYFSNLEQELSSIPSERFDYFLSRDQSRATASGEAKKTFVKSIDDILQSLKKVTNIQQFHKFAIAKCFSNEFSHQVEGEIPNKGTSIRLFDGESVFYDVLFEGNQLTKAFFNSGICPLSQAIYLDDPYLLDRLNSEEEFFSLENADDLDSLPGPLRGLVFSPHSDDLAKKLSFARSTGIVNEMLNTEKAKAFHQAISSVLSEDIQENNSKLFYGKRKIDIRNLATGLKWFVILELLLEKGFLNEKTMLIFDEPEVHLHPAWQNVMANLLSVIRKNFGCNLLISTHSPNFLMALQNSVLANDISFHIFHSQEDGDSSYTFANKDDSLNDVYDALSEPTFENDAKFASLKQKNEDH